MAELSKARTLNVSINRDPNTVYEFVSNPANFPKWAKAFCRSIKPSGSEWVAETPQGPVKISFVRKNDYGLLDHYVNPAPGVEVFVPMRVVPNGLGSEMIFTLFQISGMSDEAFTRDAELVRQDLDSLKRLMEQSTAG